MSLISPVPGPAPVFNRGALGTMHQAPMPPWRTDEEAIDYREDPRGFLLDRCHWIKHCTVFHNWIITATYYLPDKIGTAGGRQGLILPDSVHDEALSQGKVGLVIAKGPLAFKNSANIDFCGQNVEVGDWVQYDIMEGRQFTADRVHCRRLKDTQVVMKIPDPQLVY